MVMCFFMSGCTGLRTKFVRKKKAETEPVVYVDFKEYPDVPPSECYKDYYVFTQGWLSEAVHALRTSGNRKKLKQAFSESLLNMEQMAFFLDEDGREALSLMYGQLQTLQDEVAASSHHKFNKDSFIRRLESISRDFQRKFSMSNAAQWML